jgi:hypothetical protein
MAAYLLALGGAFFVHGTTWWLSLVLAYIFGIGVWSDYERLRGVTAGWFGRTIMPETFPFWLLILPFLIWVVAVLAHAEAKRRLAPKVDFKPGKIRQCCNYFEGADGGKNIQFRLLITNKTGNLVVGCRGTVSEVCKLEGNLWRPILTESVALTWAKDYDLTEMDLIDREELSLNVVCVSNQRHPYLITKKDREHDSCLPGIGVYRIKIKIGSKNTGTKEIYLLLMWDGTVKETAASRTSRRVRLGETT